MQSWQTDLVNTYLSLSLKPALSHVRSLRAIRAAAALVDNTVGRLAGIRAPSLVIHAGRDMLTAPRLSLPVEEGIPGAQGWMMGGSAHVVTDRGSREEFARRILDFLADA